MRLRRLSHERRAFVVRIAAVGVLVVGVAVSIYAFANADVCNDHVTDTGIVVDECRHLELTDPPVALVGIVALAVLGVFYTEVSGFGITLKRQVKEAQQTAEAASVVARSAQRSAEVAENVSFAQAANVTSRNEDADDPVTRQVADLAAEYNQTRDRLQSGPERTSQMTRVVSRMLALLSGVSDDDFDISGHLGSNDRGIRLAGYAYLYANPKPARIQELAAAVAKEDKPFGQYWGIRAIRKQVLEQPEALDLNTRRQLETFHSGLQAGSDRERELRATLDDASRRS
jgi:hypothetical protein